MDVFWEALAHVASPWPLFLMMLGTSLGIMVGAIPGLTGAMLIALTLPLTFSMREPADAMILLVSMYVGSVSGGLITATLLRMPGTPASMMTTLDGYPLARQGQPGRALGLGISASLIGGLISWFFLVLLSRPIAELATRLGPYDLFALVLVALVLIATVSGDSLLKGMLSGMLGILAAMPGTSPADGKLRWTGGFAEMNDGLRLLPVLVGLFAVSQIIKEMMFIGKPLDAVAVSYRGIWMTWKDWCRHSWNMVRSSLIGVFVGILPGIGANIGSVVAYSTARSFSKQPQNFGAGSEEGIVASEAANNATVGGALIPLVAMGIPGSVIDVILLGALIIHGLQPGPLLYRENPDVVHIIMATVLVSNLFMFLFMIVSVRALSRLMTVPRWLLVPVILVFCIVGSFALNNRMFDVWVMLLFGLVGFGMEKTRIPLSPFVIGFVLAPIAEVNLANGLQSSNGSLLPLFTSPFALVSLGFAACILVWTLYRRRYESSESERS